MQKQRDRECAITTNVNGTTYIWDVKTGEIIANYYKNRPILNGTAFHTSTIVSAQSDRAAIHIYNLKKELPTYICALSDKITALIMSIDGNYCFGGTEQGTIFVWQVMTGQLIKIFSAHIKSVDTLAITPDSAILISGGQDTLIRVWSVSDILDERTRDNRKVEPIHTWSSHSLGITSLSVTGGSHTKIISSSLDRTCKIFHLSSGTEICSIGFPSAITCAVLDAAEHTLFAGSSNGVVYQTDLYPFTPQYVNTSSGTKNFSIEYKDDQTFKSHTDGINGLALTQDNTSLVSISKDGSALVWDIKTKQILTTFKKTSGTSSQAITCLIVAEIPKERFLENFTSKFSISPFKKFVQVSTSFQMRFTKNTWSDMDEFEPDSLSTNVGCVDVILSEKVNVRNRAGRVLKSIK